MPHAPRRFAPSCALALFLIALGAFALAWASPAAARADAASRFKDVDQLVADQKLKEALRRLDEIAPPGAGGDEEATLAAAVRRWNILWGLGRHKETVKAVGAGLKLKDPACMAVAALYRAYFLQSYQDVYGWEIRSRPATDGAGEDEDPGTWPLPRFRAEAMRWLGEAWRVRAALGQRRVSEFGDFIAPGTYPAALTQTLRDKLSLALAQWYGNPADWTPAEAMAAATLPWDQLTGKAAPAPAAWRPEAPEGHPLTALAVAMRDDEAAHLAAGENSLALETRLRLLEALHAHVTGDGARQAFRRKLARTCEEWRADPWAGRCFFLAASWLESADQLAEAHAVAKRAAKEYGASYGGQASAALAARIEEPDFRVTAMAQDEPGRKTLRVVYRNVRKLHFRAYRRTGLRARLEAQGESAWHQEGEGLKRLAAEAPTVSWEADLPATPTFKHHTWDIVPPLTAKGAYTVLASESPDFTSGTVMANDILITGLMLVGDGAMADGAWHVRAMASADGAPRPGAKIRLYHVPWGKGAVLSAEVASDAGGAAALPVTKRGDGRWLAWAEDGEDVAYFHPETYGVGAEATRRAQVLFTTDRALYRPGQDLLWQALVYVPAPSGQVPTLAKGKTFGVALMDANGKEVARAQATADAFGTAHGRFRLPEDRMLGAWTLRALDAEGHAGLRVEAYKRPSFAVTLTPPQAASALRFNQEVSVAGEAAYHFGGPVRDGEAVWRVTRQARYAFGWGWGGKAFRPGPSMGEEQVASGVVRTDQDGRFSVRFVPRLDEAWLADNPSLAFDYVVVADVRDAGGETQSREAWVTVAMEGLSPVLSPARPFFAAGQDVAVEVKRWDARGEAQAGQGRWRLLRLAAPATAALPSQVGNEDDEGSPAEAAPRARWDGDYQPARAWRDWAEGDEVAAGALDHPAGANAWWRHGPLAAGVYRFVYVTRDEAGREVRRDLDFAVAGAETALPLAVYAWPDKTEAQVGEAVTLAWGSGFPGQKLYMDVIRGGKVVERRALAGAHGLLRLPVKAVDRGGVTYRVYGARQHEFLRQDVSVRVPYAAQRLRLAWTRFRPALSPGVAEDWEFSVTGADGKPAVARAWLLMHDKSLDALAPYAAADWSGAFPGLSYVPPLQASVGAQYPLWVRSAERPRPVVEAPEESRLRLVDTQGLGGPAFRMRGMAGGVAYEQGAPMAAPVAKTMANADASPAENAQPASAEAKRSEAPPPPPVAATRKRFDETALWRPRLTSGPDGKVRVSFTAPDALTRWRVLAQAVTADFRHGRLEDEAVTSRALTVRPQVPRFWREGDRLRLRTLIRNDGKRPLAVTAKLKITDAVSGRDLTAALAPGVDPVFKGDVAAAAEVVWEAPLVAPEAAGQDVLVSVVAEADGEGDGEERLLPLLPGRFHVQASRHGVLKGAGETKLSFAGLSSQEDPAMVPEAVVVSAVTGLWQSVLAGVPAVLDNPHDTADAWADRYAALAMMDALFTAEPALRAELAKAAARRTPLPPFAADPDRRRMAAAETPWLLASEGQDVLWPVFAPLTAPDGLARARAKALARLAALQTGEGGFAWCPGGKASAFVTLRVLAAMARVAEEGAALPKPLVEKAMAHVMKAWFPEWRASLVGEKTLAAESVFFLSVSEALRAAGVAAAVLPAKADVDAMRDAAWRKRDALPPYVKAMLAMVLARQGRKADAAAAMAPLMDQAETDPVLGTQWAPEDNTWLWYQDSVEGHAMALRALAAIDPKDPRMEGLVIWLYGHKTMNRWTSPQTTAAVLHALRAYGRARGEALAPKGQVRITVTPGATRTFALPALGPGSEPRLALKGAQVPRDAAPTVTVGKDTPGLAFVEATYAYATTKLDVAPSRDVLAVARTLYRVDPAGGPRHPLAEGEALRLGDEVEAELVVEAKAPMEFVVLKDPRPMGFEPVTALSGWTWDLGLGWYREVRDEATLFFVERLPKGKITLRHRLRVSAVGTMRHEPPVLQSFFAPAFSAYGSGARLRVEAGN